MVAICTAALEEGARGRQYVSLNVLAVGASKIGVVSPTYLSLALTLVVGDRADDDEDERCSEAEPTSDARTRGPVLLSAPCGTRTGESACPQTHCHSSVAQKC